MSSNSLEAASEILSSLPPAPFAFAYGSSIVPQDDAPQRRMIDLIVAVENAEAWHAQNLERNPSHYARALSHLGAGRIAEVQRAGAAVYFNTILQAPHARSFKYGVVTVSDLQHDLQRWDSLYLSGRLQKPVVTLTTAPPGLQAALRSNVEAAAAAALLTLPERFAEKDFYAAIAGLSYTGDVRMRLAVEVRSKVGDLVRGNMARFRALYREVACKGEVARGGDGVWRRGVDADCQRRLFRLLPNGVRQRVTVELGGKEVEVVEVARVGRAVAAAVGGIVARSSISQAVKGIATAGVGTSVRYVAAKIGRSLRAKLWR